MRRRAERQAWAMALRLGALAATGLAAVVSGCGRSGGAASSTAAAAPVVSTSIPFVGCASDGMNGPQAAPTGAPEAVQMPAADAAQLAYYDMANGPGVVGPRGWSCAGLYGSDGATLVVSPRGVQPADLASGWSGANGDGIEARVASGDTSGRFTVAKVIMRVFPAHEAFAAEVINEGIEPASNFPTGPYASDQVTTKSNEVVEFETAAGAIGLGTDTNNLNLRLAPGADPVSGVVILTGQAPDLSEVAVRLPANLRPLAGDIIGKYEADNPPAGAAAARSN